MTDDNPKQSWAEWSDENGPAIEAIQAPSGRPAHQGAAVDVGSGPLFGHSCEHRFSYDDHTDLWRCPCGATALTHPDEKLHQEAVDEADYADQGENNHW